MDFVRKIVSGDKRRYITDKFNLDLTYITDRVIGSYRLFCPKTLVNPS